MMVSNKIGSTDNKPSSCQNREEKSYEKGMGNKLERNQRNQSNHCSELNRKLIINDH